MNAPERANPLTAEPYDIVIVGAGPCGLACAIEAQRAGLTYVVVEKGCLVNTLYRFPTNMVFFSTPELLAIGGVPFIVAGEKPTRAEALNYFRKVAEAFRLHLRLHERVDEIVPEDGAFAVRTSRGILRARNVVLATGYFDTPNMLGIPGEDLPHVSHYYTEGHPFFGRDVLVVGGQNSAVEAALDLYRAGARVTLVHFEDALGAKVKPWVRPVIESHIQKGHIAVLFRTRLEEIRPGKALVSTDGERRWITADAVLAMTGYRPDHSLLRRLGVCIDPETGEPEHDPETMETNVRGLFLAGVIAAGYDANKIFIENGRFHGAKIVRRLLERRVPGLPVGRPAEAAEG